MSKIIQASFFWKNDQPGGIGLSFGPPHTSPQMLKDLFDGPVLKKYLRDSDDALGTNIVNTQLAQLSAIAIKVHIGMQPTFQEAVLVAFNIAWLSQRGFIPNDEFNGAQYITEHTT